MLSWLVCGLLDKFGLSCKFGISNLFLKHTHIRGWMDIASFLFNFFFCLHTFEPCLSRKLRQGFLFPFLEHCILSFNFSMLFFDKLPYQFWHTNLKFLSGRLYLFSFTFTQTYLNMLNFCVVLWFRLQLLTPFNLSLQLNH